MNIIFVTATGTEIGKTLVTTALCYQLQQKGFRVRGIKPVISGWADDEQSDTVHILQSLSLPVNQRMIEQTSPWRFAAPLSPDMAAAREGKILSITEIVEFCTSPSLNQNIDYLIIEGAGGVMTPITQQETMLDLMQRLQARIILVTGSYLGTLSHTLTAWEALKSRGLKLQSVIISESEGNTVSLEETMRSLRNFLSDLPIGLPRIAGCSQLWKEIPDLSIF